MKKDLSAIEQSRPYAKYFYQPVAPPPKEIIEILDRGPIDASLAIPIQQRDELLKPGYRPAEIGYCLMPDNSGYVAMLITMPNVTAEMVEWWFAWFGLESLRYKIWDPEAHYATRVVDEDLEHRLNPKLGDVERRWNTTIVVNEDIGAGAVDLRISFLSPEDFGHDGDLLKRHPNATINNINLAINEPRRPMATASHLYRTIPGGLELRARFWLGWNIGNKKPVRVVDHVPLEMAKGLTYHCAREYTNLAALLPKVYAENHKIIDKIEDFRRKG
jgi:hypothetical protein